MYSREITFTSSSLIGSWFKSILFLIEWGSLFLYCRRLYTYRGWFFFIYLFMCFLLFILFFLLINNRQLYVFCFVLCLVCFAIASTVLNVKNLVHCSVHVVRLYPGCWMLFFFILNSFYSHLCLIEMGTMTYDTLSR